MTAITDTRTESEKLFYKACTNAGISCFTLPVAKAVGYQRPDFKVKIVGCCNAVVEVKQFEKSTDETKRLADGRSIWPRSIPGIKVRQAIRQSSSQLRRFSKHGVSTAVAIFDSSFSITDTDPYNVKVGMYGRDALVIAASEGSCERVGMKRDGDVTLNRTQNTSIGAVIIVRKIPNESPVLIVYHNHFARVPFDPNHLRGHVFAQFALCYVSNGATTWIEL